MALELLYYTKCPGDNGCSWESPHTHGFACDRQCETCHGTVLAKQEKE